jgi:hypothetical protein
MLLYHFSPCLPGGGALCFRADRATIPVTAVTQAIALMIAGQQAGGAAPLMPVMLCRKAMA